MSEPTYPIRPHIDNAFDPNHLAGLDLQDEPPTAGQLTHIRRLRIRELDDGSYALYGRDPDLEEGTEPRGIVAKNERVRLR